MTCSEGGVDATTGACVPCRQRGCTDCGWDADRCDFCSEGHHFESSTGRLRAPPPLLRQSSLLLLAVAPAARLLPPPQPPLR